VDVLPDLRGAVGRGEIRAHFQPQFDVATRRIVAVEALARWSHPVYGPIPPSVFIPFAEQHNLINDIGGAMIAEGCRCAALWRERGFDVQVAVNVSAAQLATSVVVDQIEESLGKYSLPGDRLVIEITESLPVIAVPGVHTVLEQIRAAGVTISVDDFGAGHWSIDQLMELPASEVKIDKSRIHAAGPADEFIRGVVTLAHTRALRVVAEGIESEEQLALVRELGVDRAQGFLLGRPRPEGEMTQLLELSR